MKTIKVNIILLLLFLFLLTGKLMGTEIDDLLKKYETRDKEFQVIEIGNMIVFYHQRTIDNAVVEKDRIVYQFDKDSKELLHKKSHWRDDLPDHLPLIISEEEAMDIGGGTEAWLVYIDPESNVFTDVEPTPSNPCWSVAIYSDEGWNTDVIVVDAVTGEILGHGTPIP